MTTTETVPVHPETGEPLEDIAARIHADHAHALIIKPVETVAVRLVDLEATA